MGLLKANTIPGGRNLSGERGTQFSNVLEHFRGHHGGNELPQIRKLDCPVINNVILAYM